MIEDLARSAADDVRAATSSDVEAGLLDVYAAHRRHRRHASWAAASAVALALGIGWVGGQTLSGGASTPQPARHGPSTHAGPRTCAPRVECLGPSTYRFELTRPLVWRVPGSDFEANAGGGATRWQVESYARRLGPAAGVTILEGVRASTADGLSAVSSVPDTPHAFVSWLATRPFLVASPVVPTTVDGRPGWRVRVRLRTGANQGPALCDARYACHVLTRTPDGATTGIFGGMLADYTAFHVRGAGTTVAWSWAFSHDHHQLVANRLLVRGISWPAG